MDRRARPRPGHDRGSIRRRISVAATATVLMGCLLVAVLGYLAQQRAIIEGIDERLRTAAAALPEMLPLDYHDRLLRGDPVPETEYRAICAKLQRFVESAGIPYVYTYLVRDGEVFLGVVNQPPQGHADSGWLPVMMLEADPPPGVIESASDGADRFVEYTTRFGSFRSVFIPVGGPSPEQRYVIGADVWLGDMQAVLRERLLHALLIGLVVTGAVGAVAAWLGGWLSRPVVELTEIVNQLGIDADPADGRSRFADRADLEQRLRCLAAARRDETGRLARSVWGMRRRIRRYVTALRAATDAEQRLVGQLDVARQVQQGLLPRHPPPTSGVNVGAWSQPAEHVGGDFFDWAACPNEDGAYVLMLGDATGHGIGAALMAAVCRAHARSVIRDPGALTAGLGRLNDLVADDLSPGQFVTFFVAKVRADRIEVASAGHGPILLYEARFRRVRTLDTAGPPLGVFGGFEYESASEFRLEPGDTLLVTSDGFFEWRDVAGEAYGPQRLAQAFVQHAQLPPNGLIAALRAELDGFTAGTVQEDDISAMVIQRPSVPASDPLAPEVAPPTQIDAAYDAVDDSV